MFGVVPRALWEKHNPPDGKNRIRMAARALLLVGHGRVVLIDTGNGTKLDEKLRSIYAIDNTTSDLETSLAKQGLTPGDVTDVILTHLHFDHAGGATTRADGELRPTFPAAKYHVQREHWEAALKPTERDRASFFRDDFMPLYDHGVLNFTEGEAELLPGISVEVFFGHTSAMQCPVISDGKTSLLYCADLVPTTAHTPLPWIMAYDLRPLVTLDEKRRMLTRAAEEQWIMFFEHDPAVAAAHLERNEKGFSAGQPIPLV